MATERWRPLDPVRSWRLGVQVAAATSAVVGLTLLADARDSVVAWALVVASLALAGLAWWAQDRPWLARTGGWALQYVWSVAGLAALGVFSVAHGGGPVLFGLVFAVAALGAAGSYPLRGQVLHGAVIVGVVVTSWWLQPAGVTGADLLLFLGLLLTLMYLIGSLSSDIRRSVAEEARIRAVVDDRNRLLRIVGTTVTLDADEAVDVVVDAVVAAGFDVAHVGVVRDGVRHAVATRGLDEEIPPAPADEGLAGRALREGRTVVAHDYQAEPARIRRRPAVRSAVATPIDLGGDVGGVLVGARTRGPEPADEDVELLEMLALHAGHALASARRFEDEQQVVGRLRDLDRLKREFVSNVSHELRTPLTVVKGLARTLETRADSLDRQQTDELLDRINANTERLGAMLGGLLDFSRLETGVLQARPRLVDVASLVRDVVARLQPVLAGHRVELDLDAPALSQADPSLVEHVIENLLGNVAKHTPVGTAVRVAVQADDETIEIAVHDEGPGIPAEEIPHLTRRHFRGSRPDRIPVEGSGLGLALVHDILRAHDTRLEVRSDAGRGATFSFRLPLPVGVRT